jgi:hypothetical protein
MKARVLRIPVSLKTGQSPQWRIRKRFPSFSGGSVTEGFDQTLAYLSISGKCLSTAALRGVEVTACKVLLL